MKSGDWFLPMTIKEINQHALIAEALSRGAVGFTYEQGQRDSFDSSLLKTSNFAVPNLRDYLFSLAREKRAQINPQIAVIAGSAGKTSVKELVGAILKSWHPQKYFISPDNQNTKIALATQILRLPSDCQCASFEMGARRVNDFAIPLSYLQPSVVALLNIGSAHVGEFGCKENLWNEKISCLNSESAKSLVVPSDNLLILEYAMQTGKNVLSFGYSKQSSIRILDETTEQITLRIMDDTVKLDCPFQGAAKALNVAASVAVAKSMGAPLSAIQDGLQKFDGVPRRFQLFQWDRVTAIDDAFNASPESYAEGLQRLKKLSNEKRLLLVLGSMLELGESAEAEHRKVAHQIKDLFGLSARVAVATVGTEANWIHQELKSLGFSSDQLQHFQSAADARRIQNQRLEFDLIYFKGSKSIQLQTIFGDS
ncbi:Mur ligase family protein [Bdellovibrio svalbardensis]|uniref:UDP-N-acetylmuramoyl-tripeptide--D-alanyl-D-alanine ligase n=1 Tax=Bdellovibrio svalbardensis TaxID=2972972 RepID=A0ABT6DHS5_9BACT|nr:UDP-N-acetylmuramoyl-tripeptide--D-alanyl-D-alanine ligase [Bdellovibrio svalbardensis]MDG0816412.1 UDP-N-acetylmuramoyl-tripeptide--D-alanyl-D-alanine ligase [Bdellovibrio svalbardensis]